MANLEALRPYLQEVSDLQIQADGYALWMEWHGDVNSVVLQTLEEYGGITVVEDTNQSLWFFFSTEALLAAARLGVWARFNSLSLNLLFFPARLQTAHSGNKTLIFDESIWQQTTPEPEEFRIFAHKALAKVVETSPGLSLKKNDLPEGMRKEVWASLDIDPRLPFQSPLGWYVLLKPVGNVQDKYFLVGWRDFFAQVEAVLQRNKIRFSTKELFLMFPLDSLRLFKVWCREFLALVSRLKSEAQESYWPCVMAIVDKRGMNLNEDLLNKIHVDWDHLNPDFPHMSMRNALMLGDEFVAHEVRFAPTLHEPEDWASVSLRNEEKGAGSLPQLAPVSMVLGPHPYCFYCGQHSHESNQCPTLYLDGSDPALWRSVAKMEFSEMRTAVQRIDQGLRSAEEPESRMTWLGAALAENTETATMIKAFYDIDRTCQIRSIDLFWRAKGKDFLKFLNELAPIDNSPVWAELEKFRREYSPELDKNLAHLGQRYPKDFRMPSLRGFAAVQRGDLNKAEAYWKEAEVFSPTAIIQGWHVFLQARALECAGSYTQALLQYDQVQRLVPAWQETGYRKVVCQVKSGFSEAALSSLNFLINKNPHFFNMALLDPELERGYIQILANLYGLWTKMEAKAKDEQAALSRMNDELAAWFLPDHPYSSEVADRIKKLMQVGSIKNYVSFHMLVNGRKQIERDMQNYVQKESRNFKNRFKSLSTRLKTVHDESVWFPFPGALVEFNKNYNIGVANLNWAMQSNFHTPETFRKAQSIVNSEEERLDKLEGRLKFLRVVRDSTLFVLSAAQTFFWMEALGTLAIFVILPLLMLYGDRMGIDLTSSVMATERWQVQKALFFVVTVIAAGAAVLRSILRFEKIRDKILARAKEEAIKRAVRRPRTSKT